MSSDKSKDEITGVRFMRGVILPGNTIMIESWSRRSPSSTPRIVAPIGVEFTAKDGAQRVMVPFANIASITVEPRKDKSDVADE